MYLPSQHPKAAKAKHRGRKAFIDDTCNSHSSLARRLKADISHVGWHGTAVRKERQLHC